MATSVWRSGSNNETAGYCYWSSENKCSLKKKVPLTQHVFISNSQSRVVLQREKIYQPKMQAHPLPGEIRNTILWNNNGRKRRVAWTLNSMLFPSADCDGFLKNRQNHGGTVGSSFALFSSSSELIASFIFFKTSIAQRNKETVLFFFFTLRYM